MLLEIEDVYLDKTALFDVATKRRVTYRELKEITAEISQSLPSKKQLIFINANNDIETILFYVACINAGHAIHLLDPTKPDLSNNIIKKYNPNIVYNLDEGAGIKRLNEVEYKLHPDLVILLSTSGSTGTPKFVRLSKQNIRSNALSIAEYLNINSDERALAHLKFHYSYGMSVVNSHLAVGGACYVTNDSVIDETFWKDLNEHSITSFAGVPYTFSSIDSKGIELADYPTLRYLTQAGGKMKASDVRRWSAKCRDKNIDFFVMYGQTEASPRISYLPPKLSTEHPDSIGVPIPGGKMYLIDETGRRIDSPNTEGELAYSGPNVMMGYANSVEELQHGNNHEFLLTGDLAKFDDKGLFRIVGRKSRFVKPFGIRVNLDDIEKYANQFVSDMVVTGNDQKIVLAHPNSTNINQTFIDEIVNHFKIPKSVFLMISCGDLLPRLSNGKVDYNKIKTIAGVDGDDYTPPKKPLQKKLRDIFTWRFLELYQSELLLLLGFKKGYESVSDIFCEVFVRETVGADESFQNLGGDSLNYVSMCLGLESAFGYLPEDWELKTISALQSELDALRK